MQCFDFYRAQPAVVHTEMLFQECNNAFFNEAQETCDKSLTFRQSTFASPTLVDLESSTEGEVRQSTFRGLPTVLRSVEINCFASLVGSRDK